MVLFMELGSLADWTAVAAAIGSLFAAGFSYRASKNANKISARLSIQALTSAYLPAMARWKNEIKDDKLADALQRHTIANLIMLVDECNDHSDDHWAGIWAKSFGDFPLIRSGAYPSDFARNPRTRDAIEKARHNLK